MNTHKMSRRKVLVLVISTSLAFAAFSSCADMPPSGLNDSLQTLEQQLVVDTTEQWESVFTRVAIFAPDGTIIHDVETGELTPEVWQKAARPDPERDGPFIYSPIARTEVSADGTTKQSIEFRRRPNDIRPAPSIEPDDNKLSDYIRPEPEEPDVAYVAVSLAGFPKWDIPLELPEQDFTDEQVETSARQRSQALLAREALFEELRRPVDELVSRYGGTVETASWTSGWVGARLPIDSLADLATEPSVRRISGLRGLGGSHDWILGQSGIDSRYDVDQLSDLGFDGRSGVVVGIIETGLFDDEACLFFDGASCITSSRILSRHQCDNPVSGSGGNCDAVNNFSDPSWYTPEVQHATVVASIAIGDYTDGQADAYEVGDPNWTSPGPHSSLWESRATSFAPEAYVRLAGGFPNPLNDFGIAAEAIDDVSLAGVRIINNSWSYSETLCNENDDTVITDALENAFDDGRLIVNAAGNDPNQDLLEFGPCDTTAHASLPKVLAVNSLSHTDSITCESDYQTCPIRVGAAAYGGGAAVTPDGVTRLYALSMISLSAVDGIMYRTGSQCNSLGSRGEVVDPTDSWTFGDPCAVPVIGSSFAAPAVTSAAVVVYEWAVDRFGASSANGVGKLQAIMLGMADSHYLYPGDSATQQRVRGVDRRFGMGRLKVRSPTVAALAGATVTEATSDTIAITTTPLAAGHKLVKCVALVHEDMSHKTRISHVQMTLELRYPTLAGSCSSTASLYQTEVDGSYDVKKMTRILSTNATGKCAYAKLYGVDVEGSSVPASVFCYASTEDDDEPN